MSDILEPLPHGARSRLCTCGHPLSSHDEIDHDAGASPGDVALRRLLGLRRFTTRCRASPADGAVWATTCDCIAFRPARPSLRLIVASLGRVVGPGG